MLPNFARLRLDDRRKRSAPTGEFWALSQTKADELNEGGRGDPIGFDTYRPFQAVASPHATFRVRNRDPQGDGTYGYTYYNAATLWQWAKDNSKLPLTGEPIWKEDWWSLHNRYTSPADMDKPAPAWVRRLPQLDPSLPDNASYEARQPTAANDDDDDLALQGFNDEDDDEVEFGS